jgi:hypothetical protein
MGRKYLKFRGRKAPFIILEYALHLLGDFRNKFRGELLHELLPLYRRLKKSSIFMPVSFLNINTHEIRSHLLTLKKEKTNEQSIFRKATKRSKHNWSSLRWWQGK